MRFADPGKRRFTDSSRTASAERSTPPYVARDWSPRLFCPECFDGEFLGSGVGDVFARLNARRKFRARSSAFRVRSYPSDSESAPACAPRPLHAGCGEKACTRGSPVRAAYSHAPHVHPPLSGFKQNGRCYLLLRDRARRGRVRRVGVPRPRRCQPQGGVDGSQGRPPRCSGRLRGTFRRPANARVARRARRTARGVFRAGDARGDASGDAAPARVHLARASRDRPRRVERVTTRCRRPA